MVKWRLVQTITQNDMSEKHIIEQTLIITSSKFSLDAVSLLC